MGRQYEVTSGTAPGGVGPQSRSQHRADTLRDSFLLATYAPLPRGEFAQAMFDIGTLCVWMLLGLLGAVIVGGPVIVVMWMLFFS